MATRQVTPSSTATNPITVPGGRKYSCAVGSTILVPDFDAKILEANGWIGNDAAATANRPTLPTRGQIFLDTTVGAEIRWDGNTWRNLATGAAV